MKLRMNPIRARLATPLATLLLAAALLGGMLPLPAATPAEAAPQACGTAPAPRLAPGMSGRVTITPDGTGNNLRQQANTTATVLGVMPVGEVFTVLNGPTCAENFYWYEVRRWDGQTGWTAEGITGNYWIEPWPQSGAQIATGPAPNAENGRFAFLSGQGSNFAAFTSEYNGTDRRALGSILMVDNRLAWSPDGQSVALFDGVDVWVIGPGIQAQNVTSSPASSDYMPTWSPDGQRIAFVSTRDGNPEIYIYNRVTFVLTRLTNAPGIDHEPRWSPSGTQIAFVSDRDGNLDLYVMTTDGLNVQQVSFTDPGTSVSDPQWAPDGLQLAWVAAQDGGTTTILTGQPGLSPVPLTPGRVARTPHWSPDGQRIAFIGSTTPGDAPGGPEDVFSVRPDGSDLIQYTINGAQKRGLSWTPDGEWLLFSDRVSGNFEVYAVRSGGFGLANLTNNPLAEDTYPYAQPAPGAVVIGQPGQPGPATTPPPAATPITATLPPVNPAEEDLLLIFDPGVPVFTLVNRSGASINLAPLAFQGAGISFQASLWEEYSVSSMTNFQYPGCLMLWPFGIADQPAPAECGAARQGWINDSRYTFWTGASFDVYYNGALVTTCTVAAGRCSVDLP